MALDPHALQLIGLQTRDIHGPDLQIDTTAGFQMTMALSIELVNGRAVGALSNA